MSDISVFSSRFNSSSISLKEYDDVLRFLRKHKKIIKTSETDEKIQNILKVLEPISDVIEGRLSRNIAIDERSVVRTIKQRHEKEWYSYKFKILNLNSKLKSGKFALSEQDFEILNDVADALDIECSYLFKRLSEL